ncbi:dihydrolipoamide dehydrogenase [Chromatiales bacterium (ex Bugula neritina AB1)]|nr:dihydrolipoamide dehydrogenase [Chromatiales bacterium (ex Bugula neritina AB1)]
MKNKKLWIAAIAIALIAAFFVFDLGKYLSLEYLKQQHQTILDFYSENRLITIAMFFLLYVAVAALSLPGAAILTLAAGAIFGLAIGLIIVSFASTIGATLAFLISRFMFRETVQTKFGSQLETINQGVEKEGAFYLFTLRLIPVVPFFVVNLLMGLTPIKAMVFAWVSQLGMLPGTAVFVNAGDQLSKIESLSDILSPSLLAAFALLGIFPIAAKKLLNLYKNRAAKHS